jgi:chromosome partitioning protein
VPPIIAFVSEKRKTLCSDSGDYLVTIIASCVNLKGGVGKTALAVNFAAYCGAEELKTLLVDLDPQTNATFSTIGVDEWEKHAANYGTVADLFGLRSHTTAEGASKDIKSIIKKDVFDGVDLIPSHLDLFTIDLDLAPTTARETKLRRAIQPIIDDYDIIICDCPPNLTIPTQNALAMSSHYIVPISPDFLSGLGVGLLITRVKKFCDELEHTLALGGIVISRVGRPAQHREATVAAMRATFKNNVLDTEIRERVAVSEAAASHRPIYDMGDANASAEFSAVSEELLNRMGVA